MKKFDSKSCEEIMITVYKPIEFVVDNMIAQGLYILAGAPKVGKCDLKSDSSAAKKLMPEVCKNADPAVTETDIR